MKVLFVLRYSVMVFILLLGVILVPSCKKDEVSSDPAHQLLFSVDTLAFDTVFSTVGSSTRIFKIYNPNDEKVNISSIKVKGGASSLFRININGKSGIAFTDIELRANDSLWVFAEVTVDPGNVNTPFVVEDELLFQTNGNNQGVLLLAYGQNAIFHKPNTGETDIKITNDTKWDASIPHVIFGNAVVDSGYTLSIEEGTHVYFHANSSLVFKEGSSLKINGTLANPVLFEGTRLESWYENTPGQWQGIVLEEGSVDHEINGLKLKNAIVGIYCSASSSTGSAPALKIGNTEIKNCSYEGLVLNNSSAIAWNNLVVNCGSNALLIEGGVDYEFMHCTFSNNVGSANESVSNESVLIKNWSLVEGAEKVGDLNKCNFTNCIIYGGSNNSLLLSEKEGEFNYLFSYSLVKKQDKGEGSTGFNNCVWNENPMFVEVGNNNFNLSDKSPAENIGDEDLLSSNSEKVTLDLNGNSRSLDVQPDAGCYEFVE